MQIIIGASAKKWPQTVHSQKQLAHWAVDVIPLTRAQECSACKCVVDFLS